MSLSLLVESHGGENGNRSCPGLVALPDELENGSNKENRPKSQKYDRVQV